MRFLIKFLLLVAIVAAIAWFAVGRLYAPGIEIRQPTQFIGSSSQYEIAVAVPQAELTDLKVTFEQNGQAQELTPAQVTSDGGASVVVRGPIGRAVLRDVQEGAGTLRVTASRMAFGRVRTKAASAERDLQVRLRPPRVQVLSTHHYINQGGAEAIVYRVEPAGVPSGVMVGDRRFPGHPAAGAANLAPDLPRDKLADPAVHIAFFALDWNQDPNAPMYVFAEDEAGNRARADFERRVFPRAFNTSTIELDDPFLNRVVPAIEAETTSLTAQGSLIERYLAINRDLRTRNNDEIAKMREKTAKETQWSGAFVPFKDGAVQAAFADQRTYMYQGKEVDRQVHLGFDLASNANAPVIAGNRGTVVFADYLGIYGNCVIIDHGMGLQSLYGHLSSIGTSVGHTVERGAELGRTGITGLAGGDHLHYTMLLQGQSLNPVEWWDQHWIEDRILRKLRLP
ncbi:MAG: M23 family metallopeptidase [Vicinamibacterales bacterium]